MVSLIRIVLVTFIAVSSFSLRAMEEGILPKNPKNAVLLKQKIKDYFRKAKKGTFGDIHYFAKCLHEHPVLYPEYVQGVEKKLYENLCKHCDKKGGDDTFVLINVMNRGYFEEIEMVLLAGADPNACAPHRSSALFQACGSMCQFDERYKNPEEKKDELVKMLLDAGDDPNWNKSYGKNTPLHVACILGRANVVKLLLQAGADATITNKYGKTALDIARNGGKTKIVALLEKEEEEFLT